MARCEICKKPIKVREKRFGNNNNVIGIKIKTIKDSAEGVYFVHQNIRGVWFCNSCFKEIIKYHKKKIHRLK